MFARRLARKMRRERERRAREGVYMHLGGQSLGAHPIEPLIAVSPGDPDSQVSLSPRDSTRIHSGAWCLAFDVSSGMSPSRNNV